MAEHKIALIVANGYFEVRVIDESGVRVMMNKDVNLESCLQRAVTYLGYPLVIPIFWARH
jgi:hypothetical protein